MKKLFLSIVVLGLLLSGNGYAKKPEVSVIDKNENFIILLIENINSAAGKENVNASAYNQVLKTANSYCSSLGKKTYSVYEFEKDFSIHDWRWIRQVTFWGNRRSHIFQRFFCSNDMNDIFVIFTENHSIKSQNKLKYLFSELKKKANQELILHSKNAKKPNAILEITNSMYGSLFSLDDIYKNRVVFKDAIDVKENILRAKEFDNKDQQFNYVCKEQLNLKKGTEKFNDCVYKIITMELELAKINAEKEIAIAKAETARANQQLAEEATAKAIAQANSQKFKKNISNLLVGLLVLGEINQASQQATNFKRTFTCTPTGFASGLQYSVNCY